jgi:hypothetical protein
MTADCWAWRTTVFTKLSPPAEDYGLGRVQRPDAACSSRATPDILEAIARTHQSRVPGPAGPGLWAQVAQDELADPYLVASARYQEAAALLTGRGSRRRAARLLR